MPAVTGIESDSAAAMVVSRSGRPSAPGLLQRWQCILTLANGRPEA